MGSEGIFASHPIIKEEGIVKKALYIVSVVAGISLIVNIGFVVARVSSITDVNKQQNMNYTMVPSLLALASLDLQDAESGKDISGNLDLARGYIEEANGLLRGLSPDAEAHGIDFSGLTNDLQVTFGLPLAHGGAYSKKEISTISSVKTKLDQCVHTLKGTQYTSDEYSAIKDKVNHLTVSLGDVSP
jgi:hypothetical protein